ncbi:glycosyltransferase family 2 protein, partial [Patescibacteria group bacterium]|nr:glycosyltransferase family 2 protein [Patescibacteria group bacterium]
MIMPKVIAVIVNWNNFKDTKECLRFLGKINYDDFGVVIVDNGSTDNSGKDLQKEFPQYNYIFNNSNLGFAGGANLGIKYALNKKCNYVWILNNDTVSPNVNYLRELVELAEQRLDCGVIGSLVLNYGNEFIQSEWFTFVPWMGRFIPLNQGMRLDEIKETTLALRPKEYLNAASMLVKSHVFSRAGFFPEDFFLYFEDNVWEDFVRKVVPNLNICYTSKVFILHKGASSSGGYKKSVTLDYYDTRNYLYFIKESYPRWIIFHI